MSLLKSIILIAIIGIMPACDRPSANAVEFRHFLEKDYGLLQIFGIGFGDYDDPEKPSDFRAFGPSLKGNHASYAVAERLVYVGKPKILIGTLDGERHMIEPEWVGEVPPRVFDGKIFIRVTSIDAALIHWDADPYARWVR